MNIGEGEAVEKAVHILLSGAEIVLRLTASALKNTAAFLLAMARNHKKVYGKTRLVKLLQQTRDLQCIQMTKEQFKAFQQDSKPLGILYAAVQDKRGPGAVALILPATELSRANNLLERLRVVPETRTEVPREKEPRQRQESRDSREPVQRERSSIEERLKDIQAEQRKNPAPARAKAKVKTNVKVR